MNAVPNAVPTNGAPMNGAPSAQGSVTVGLDAPWTVSPRVAVRPEPFGALLYHFGNRRLSFLKRPDIVGLVQSLGEHASVRDALHAARIPESSWTAYLRALDSLARADMICPSAKESE